MTQPLDPFSEVVDENRRWKPEWYSWLKDNVTAGTFGVSMLSAAEPIDLQTQIDGLRARIEVLEAKG